uniref:DENN domain-containing protein 11 n=1 Tax=Latimeria chalumnae TaxID=7897 RepID=H3ADI4_LATCH
TGNIVEWCLPQDVDLEGVEFKSMASGSHKIQSDFMYLKFGTFFKLSCSAQPKLNKIPHRDFRTTGSLPVLITDNFFLFAYYFIYLYFKKFLCKHNFYLTAHRFRDSAFTADFPPFLHINKGERETHTHTRWLAVCHKFTNIYLQITHPAGCMSQFIKFFGEQILILWKFALLRKRILIFSPPPVGVVCYRGCILSCVCVCVFCFVFPGGGGSSVPHYTPSLQFCFESACVLVLQVRYCPGTTEKIFEEKKDLYDVFVDNQNVKTHHEHLQQLLKINSADKDKFRKLNDQRQMLLYSQEVNGDCSTNEEDLFVLFFMEQNNRIFQTLMEVSGCQDKTLTADHVRSMGLDPQGDRNFLMDLLEVYGIDVMLVIDNPCCP